MKRILFAHKKDWIEPVAERLDRSRFEASFCNFRDPALQFSQFDGIVPLRLSDYAPLRAYPGRAAFLIPDPAAVAIADDKPRFMTFLHHAGFGEFAPTVYRDAVRYPFIYKKCVDVAGKNARIVFSPEEHAAFEARIVAAEYFRQEYVGGRTEYTSHFLAVDGRPTFDTTLEFTFDHDHFVRGLRWEAASSRKIDTPFADLFGAILKALSYTGTGCFNYKIESGRPKIFELNPRAGGSLRLDLDAYLDAYLAALAEYRTPLSRRARNMARSVAGRLRSLR
jgi:carbamoylphosphate synthase large subunit